MRPDVKAVMEWERAQVQHPSRNWRGLCLRSAREAWGLPVLAPSARSWWALIPPTRRYHTPPTEVPAGAMCYADIGHYGHAWIMGHNGTAFSTDYFRSGHIDHVRDGALQRWTHDPKVFWTGYVPGHGRLPLA
jgi:hypothetical protein